MNVYAAALLHASFVLCTFGIWVFVVLRIKRNLQSPAEGVIPPDGVPELGWSEWAWLCGEDGRVCEAAATWLLQHGYAEYRAAERRLILLRVPQADCDPAGIELARWIADPIAGGSIDALQPAAEGRFGGIRDRMVEIGLAIPTDRRFRLGLFGVLQFFGTVVPMLLVMLSGFLFFAYLAEQQGRARSQNPEFLFTTLGVGGGLLFWSFGQMGAMNHLRHLTAAGKRAVKDRVKSAWPDRGFFEIYGPPPGTEANLALAVALYGTLTLTKTPLASFQLGFADPNAGG